MLDEMKEYREGVVAAWQGERQAEAFLSSVASLEEDADRRLKWQALAELEREMGNRLSLLMAGDADDATRSEQGLSFEPDAKTYQRLPHADAMRQMKAVIEPAVERFRRLLAIAPQTHRETMQLLVDHELALKVFVEREMTGDSKTSLEGVQSILNHLRKQSST